MKKYSKLSEKERKDEIMNIALDIFLEKGISSTTMTDIIKASNLSRGGVYNHYSSKEDILYDLMMKGSNRRLEITRNTLKNTDNENINEVFTELMIDKMFEKSDYHKLYGMFLYEMRFNDRLKEMYKDIEEEATQVYIDFLDSEEFSNLDLSFSKKFTTKISTFLFNSIFLGKELFDYGSEDEIKDVVRLIAKSYAQYVFEKENK